MSHNQRQLQNNQVCRQTITKTTISTTTSIYLINNLNKYEKRKRPENIDSILSKLTPGSSADVNIDNTSTISMEELESLEVQERNHQNVK